MVLLRVFDQNFVTLTAYTYSINPLACLVFA